MRILHPPRRIPTNTTAATAARGARRSNARGAHCRVGAFGEAGLGALLSAGILGASLSSAGAAPAALDPMIGPASVAATAGSECLISGSAVAGGCVVTSQQPVLQIPGNGSGTSAVTLQVFDGSLLEYTNTAGGSGGSGGSAPPVGVGRPANDYGSLSQSTDGSTFTWISGTSVVTFAGGFTATTTRTYNRDGTPATLSRTDNFDSPTLSATWGCDGFGRTQTIETDSATGEVITATYGYDDQSRGDSLAWSQGGNTVATNSLTESEMESLDSLSNAAQLGTDAAETGIEVGLEAAGYLF